MLLLICALACEKSTGEDTTTPAEETTSATVDTETSETETADTASADTGEPHDTADTGATDTAVDTAVDTAPPDDTAVDDTPVRIDPDDPALRYEGRIDDSYPLAIPFHWPATSVSTIFTGTSVTAFIDDAGDNYLNVTIDGEVAVVDLAPGPQVLTLAEGLAEGEHTLEILKRTEVGEGDFSFEGLSLDPGASLIAPEVPALKLEFYGDSITSGMSADCECDDGAAEYKNAGITYAAVAADALGAEHRTHSVSGLGIIQSWWPATIYDYWDGLYAGDAAWDFTAWTPDVVVINLGQNDYWLGVRGEIVDAYVDFAGQLRGHYPDAWIVLALGSMDAVELGSPMPGFLTAAADLLVAGGDPAVSSLIFDYNGWGGHPIEADHQHMADQLVEHLREVVPEVVGE